MPRKIIIDTDPGVDDAMAIFMALRSPELEVIGLTTIFGNVETHLATKNALRLLEIAGRADIPVARGADHPLAVPFGGPVPFVHGDDGQGNLHLPAPTTTAISECAAVFIIEQVMKYPGEITLVPIAPLTNIALALRLEPRIEANIKEIVMMGGNAIEPGNATPAAEANVHNDPEAADVVFGAHWQVTMVGLDVTHKTVMQAEHIAAYERANHAMGQHVAKIIPFYLGFNEEFNGMPGMFTHDPSAIAYLINPSLFQTKQWPIRVETQGFGRGKTWPAINNKRMLPPWKDRPLVNVCTGVDADGVIALVLERLS